MHTLAFSWLASRRLAIGVIYKFLAINSGSNPKISDDEQAQLRELARTTKDKKTADRIRIILALAAGDRACDVARIFCIDEPTVRKWKNRYQKRRLFSDWLATLQTGYGGKLTSDQLAKIEAYVEANE